MNKQSLTHKVNLIASETGLPFNTVMTHFFLEVALSRIAVSEVGKNLIFKGGFLLSNILGIKSRTTVDIDLLVTGINMVEESVRALVNQTLKQPVIPEVSCVIQSIDPIRNVDEYGGYRVRILCRLENIRQIVPLDFAAGDPITPEAIQYQYNPLFSDNPIQITSYNIETLLAEKIETVYRRGLVNSRCKDFYDIHLIWKLKRKFINDAVLKHAFVNTCSYRLTKPDINEFFALLKALNNDEQMAKRWDAYVKRNAYSKEISFDDTLSTLMGIIPLVF